MDSDGSASDNRSALVLVEPVWTSKGVTWHSMAFVGGECINDVRGPHRTAVLEDSLDALDGAGIPIETTESG